MNIQLRYFGVVVMGALSALAGCGSDLDDGGPGGTACTDLAAASVSVAVVDSAGAAVADAMLTFSVDGGAPQACDNMMNGSYVCGYEQAGMITISATKGADTATQTVTVSKDGQGCHVVGQSITMTLGA
ncbi:MAG TPA: hypothetical protein PK156_50655 [Polyangium sp.]|nr:hypothetical protein [Polyangium sp.]